MPTQKTIIIQEVYKILNNSPDGIRYMDLVNAIHDSLPNINIGSIHATICNLKKNR